MDERTRQQLVDTMIDSSVPANRRAIIHRVLDRMPIEALRLTADNGTKISVLRRDEKFIDRSSTLQKIGVNPDLWPAPPAGLFVPDDRTLYVRECTPMAIAHEYGHALDLAIGGDQYATNLDANLIGMFQRATSFVTEYAALGRDEWFAENFRAFVEVNDANSHWAPATREKLARLEPELFAFFEQRFGSERALEQGVSLSQIEHVPPEIEGLEFEPNDRGRSVELSPSSNEKRNDFYKALTADVLRMIEVGGLPEWQRFWTDQALSGAAMNPTTGNHYRGINSLRLALTSAERGFNDPRWMTMKQANAKGWRVCAGEKATPIEVWKWQERYFDKDSGEALQRGEALERIADPQRKDSVKVERHGIYRTFPVFNAAQIEVPVERDGEIVRVPFQELYPHDRERIAREREWQPHDRAERIVAALAVPVLHIPQPRAYYSPMHDQIVMPTREQFASASDYYDVLLHESGHSTGHSSRLNRETLYRIADHRWYAREELRAELTSFFMAAELGLPHNAERHAAYLGSWASLLRDNHMEIYAAARDAQAAQEFMLGREAEHMKTLEASRDVQQAPDLAPAAAEQFFVARFVDRDSAGEINHFTEREAQIRAWAREWEAQHNAGELEADLYAAGPYPSRAVAADALRELLGRHESELHQIQSERDVDALVAKGAPLSRESERLSALIVADERRSTMLSISDARDELERQYGSADRIAKNPRERDVLAMELDTIEARGVAEIASTGVDIGASIRAAHAALRDGALSDRVVVSPLIIREPAAPSVLRDGTISIADALDRLAASDPHYGQYQEPGYVDKIAALHRNGITRISVHAGDVRRGIDEAFERVKTSRISALILSKDERDQRIATFVHRLHLLGADRQRIWAACTNEVRSLNALYETSTVRRMMNEYRAAVRQQLGEDHASLRFLRAYRKDEVQIAETTRSRIAERLQNLRAIDPELIVEAAERLMRSDRWTERVAGVAIATGRRIPEIAAHGWFEPYYDDKTPSLSFVGAVRGQDREMVIPVLAEPQLVLDTIHELRTQKPLDDKTPSQISNSYGKNISDAISRELGTAYSPAELRDLYATIAHDWYASPATSISAYFGHVLGFDPSDSTTTLGHFRFYPEEKELETCEHLERARLELIAVTANKLNRDDWSPEARAKIERELAHLRSITFDVRDAAASRPSISGVTEIDRGAVTEQSAQRDAVTGADANARQPQMNAGYLASLNGSMAAIAHDQIVEREGALFYTGPDLWTAAETLPITRGAHIDGIYQSYPSLELAKDAYRDARGSEPPQPLPTLESPPAPGVHPSMITLPVNPFFIVRTIGNDGRERHDVLTADELRRVALVAERAAEPLFSTNPYASREAAEAAIGTLPIERVYDEDLHRIPEPAVVDEIVEAAIALSATTTLTSLSDVAAQRDAIDARLAQLQNGESIRDRVEMLMLRQQQRELAGDKPYSPLILTPWRPEAAVLEQPALAASLDRARSQINEALDRIARHGQSIDVVLDAQKRMNNIVADLEAIVADPQRGREALTRIEAGLSEMRSESYLRPMQDGRGSVGDALATVGASLTPFASAVRGEALAAPARTFTITGLMNVFSMAATLADQRLAELRANGEQKDVDDAARRAGVARANVEKLQLLAKSGLASIAGPDPQAAIDAALGAAGIDRHAERQLSPARPEASVLAAGEPALQATSLRKESSMAVHGQRVTLIGSPALKNIQELEKVTRLGVGLSVPTNEKKDGKTVYATEWYDVAGFDANREQLAATAKAVGQNKDQLLKVEGHVVKSSYPDKSDQNKKHFTTEVVIDSVSAIDKKSIGKELRNQWMARGTVMDFEPNEKGTFAKAKVAVDRPGKDGKVFQDHFACTFVGQTAVDKAKAIVAKGEMLDFKGKYEVRRYDDKGIAQKEPQLRCFEVGKDLGVAQALGMEQAAPQPALQQQVAQQQEVPQQAPVQNQVPAPQQSNLPSITPTGRIIPRSDFDFNISGRCVGESQDGQNVYFDLGRGDVLAVSKDEFANELPEFNKTYALERQNGLDRATEIVPQQDRGLAREQSNEHSLA